MVLGQLLLIGLPVFPTALDCYLQAKFKQLVITPIYNLLYTIFVSVLGSILVLLLGILVAIAKAGITALKVVYQDYLLTFFSFICVYVHPLGCSNLLSVVLFLTSTLLHLHR